MTDERALRGVLERMGRAAVPVDDEDDAVAMREHLVAHVSTLIESQATRARRPQLTRYWTALALAASVSLLALGAHTRLGATPRETADVIAEHGAAGLIAAAGEIRSLSPGARASIAAGDGVETHGAGTALLSLSEASVALSGESAIRLETLVPGSQSLRVLRGLVSFTVAKLGERGTFSVITNDARVVVHGTAFTVRADRWTRVTVSAGLVAVHHDGEVAMLHAGDTWSSEPSVDVASAAPAQRTEPSGALRAPALAGISSHGAKAPRGVPLATVSRPDQAKVHVPSRNARPSEEPARAPATDSDAPSISAASEARALHEANEMFRDAMAARRQGDTSGALALLGRLLIEHPSSPIAHEVRVEQMRLLARAGNGPAAARAASRYLSLYPDGFAASEARELAE